MAATIKIKNSSTTGSVPSASNLVQGELAVNVTDLGLYTENASGTVVKLNAPSIDDKNTGATKYLTIDTSGNLGLGVTPKAWSGYKVLDFYNTGAIAGDNGNFWSLNNAYYNGSNYIYKTSTYASGYLQTGGQHWWYTAASGTAGNAITFTQAMTLDASGNLGIGTSSPDQKLHVYGNSGSTTLAVGDNTITQPYVYLRADATSSVATLITRSNHALTFGTNNTERARISSSGYFMMGATSTIGSGSAQLSIEGGGGVVCGIKSSGGATNECIFNWNNATSGNNLFNSFYTETSATGRGSIDYNRGAGLVRYNTTSDATLKNIIGDADGTKSVDILKSTRIREYSWKDDQSNKKQIGVIAQELYETFSGAVSVGGDKVEVDEEGNETTRYIPWAVDKTAFTFHLVAGWQAHEKIIQEQQAIITALTARIEALEQA